jgi:uncharacterized repeat protein (TIGR01451 family)
MKTFAVWALVAIGLMSVSPGKSFAATADGALITNVACATFSSNQAGTQGFAVSYCATVAIIVQNPCIALQKVANPTVQASGGLVTFTLWVVNCSCTSSAWNITVTDRMPDNTAYEPGTFLSWPGNATPGVWTPSYSSNNTTWAGPQPVSPQGAPYYLRYTLDVLGPCKSAFARFSVEIL